MNKKFKEIFKKGSKTYFNSSLFFPKSVREDVFILYAFVRIADDFVDSVPQDTKAFYEFKSLYEKGVDGAKTNNLVIDAFIDLMKRKNLKKEWVDAFLHSMEMDIKKNKYYSIDETLEYIYGSAEVIGLFMASLLNLPEQAFEAAQMQGRAMQYINFIRDIDEDNQLGRTYLPFSESEFNDLKPSSLEGKEKEFVHYIREQIQKYYIWQKKAESGYRYIPKRYLIPIKTAAEMYSYTADKIHDNPFIVFEKKVKPKKSRIFRQIFKNWIILKKVDNHAR